MRRRMLSKGLTVAVIVLFIGMAVQPSIATVPLEDEIDVDAKEYLFQTIIDIANNPDVRDFLKQNNHNGFISDYDFKGLYSELLVKNPRFFTRLLFTKPSMSHGYLDKIYDIGSDMVDTLGEEQVYEIMESIVVSNTEFFDELSNIVLNDVALSDRIDTLIEMNQEAYSDEWPFPILCFCVLVIFLPPYYVIFMIDKILEIISPLYMYSYLVAIICHLFMGIQNLLLYLCLPLGFFVYIFCGPI